MSVRLITTVRLSVGRILSAQEIIAATYFPKGALRNEALLNGSEQRHTQDFLFISLKGEALRVFGEAAVRDAGILEGAGVRVYRRPVDEDRAEISGFDAAIPGSVNRALIQDSDNSVVGLRQVRICCPHCQRSLSETEVRSILGQFAQSSRLSWRGASRFAKMTPEQRSAEARKARWAKLRKPDEVESPVATDSAVACSTSTTD